MSTPSQLFLWLYPVYVVVGFILMGRYLDTLVSFSQSASSESKISPINLSAYAIASLRWPKQGPAELALYELWRADLVDDLPGEESFRLKAKPYQPNKPNKPNKARHLTPIARAAHKMLLEPTTFEVFRARLAENPLLVQEFSSLTKEGLFSTDAIIKKELLHTRLWIVFIGVLLLFPGVLKFFLAITDPIKNYGLISMLHIEVAVVIVMVFVMYLNCTASKPTITKRGETLFSELRGGHGWWRSNKRRRCKATDDLSPVIALFGVSAIEDMPPFAGFYKLMNSVDPLSD